MSRILIDSCIDNALKDSISLDEHMESPELIKKKLSSAKNTSENTSDISLNTFLANEYDLKLNKNNSSRNNNGRKINRLGDKVDRSTALN